MHTYTHADEKARIFAHTDLRTFGRAHTHTHTDTHSMHYLTFNSASSQPKLELQNASGRLELALNGKANDCMSGEFVFLFVNAMLICRTPGAAFAWDQIHDLGIPLSRHVCRIESCNNTLRASTSEAHEDLKRVIDQGS